MRFLWGTGSMRWYAKGDEMISEAALASNEPRTTEYFIPKWPKGVKWIKNADGILAEPDK